MQTRLWLASTAAVAVVATGVFVAGPTLHGQTPKAPASDVPDADALRREINEAVSHALDQAFVHEGQFDLNLKKTIESATRAAQDAVRDLDVEVFVDDAMQGAADVAMLGGRPRIGVSTRDVTDEEAKAAGLTGITGAYVSDVAADSAAGKAGIQAKDIIVSVDGENIRSARQLSRVIGESPDGRALQIGYVRGTARSTASVTPELRGPRAMAWAPGEFGFSSKADGDGAVIRKFERRVGPGDLPDKDLDVFVPRKGPDGGEFFFRQGPGGGMRIWSGRGRLGVVVQPLTEQLASYFGVKEGVLVTQVTEASSAAKAGLKAGDVITAINGKPVTDAGDVIDGLQGIENGKTVPVAITRDKKPQTITVTLETPASTSRDRVVTRRQRFTA